MDIINNKNYQVLIVDDTPTNIQLAGSILQQENYEIAFAQNGKIALELLESHNFDLILLDIMMPEMNGFEVCKRLKASEKTKDIPVIFLSAKKEREDVIEGLKIGAVDYVTKPFNSEELIVRTRTHLELKRARDNQKRLIHKLQKALAEIRQLSGLLPICSHCKNIRDDIGKWVQIDEYIASKTEAEFTHSICPHCLKKHYPQIADKVLERME